MSKLIITGDKFDLEVIQDQLYEYGKQTGHELKSEIIDEPVEANESLSKESENKIKNIIDSIEDSVKEIIEIEDNLKSDSPVKEETKDDVDFTPTPTRETIFPHKPDISTPLPDDKISNTPEI